MSGVGSVSASDSNSSLLYLLYLQNAGLTGAAAGTTAVSSTNNSSATTDPTTTAGAAGSTTSSTTSNLSDLRSQLETAITNAINNVSDPNNPTDVLGAVHNAIDTTLQANGINPQQAQRHGGAHGHHHHAKVESDSSADSASADPTVSDPTTTDSNVDATTDGSGTDQSSGIGSNSSQDLLAILLSIGSQSSPTTGSSSTSATTGQSTQPNSLAAILSASSANGSSNGGLDLNTLFGQLFASFPPGSGLNIEA